MRTLTRTALSRRAVLLALCAAILTAGCIKDDIPYPHIQANIQDIVAVGQSQNARIDSIKKTVTLYFPEETDIYNVMIEDYRLTPGAVVQDSAFSQPLDLSRPALVKLFLYYDYEWTITGVQTIERYMSVNGQVGATAIDVPARRVVL